MADMRAEVRLLRGHRYEHVAPTAATFDHRGLRLQVFRWSRSTHVAE